MSEEEIEEIEENYWRSRGRDVYRRVTRRKGSRPLCRDEAVRTALPRAGVGRESDPGHRSAAGRSLHRDRTGPRRADAAARWRGPAACWRSKSTATWPPICATSDPRAHASSRAIFSSTADRSLTRATPGAPRRRQPALQRRLADPVQARRAARRGRAARGRDRHAAARGRRPAGRPRRADATTASSASWSSTRPTSSGCSTLPPGAFRPAPKVRSALVRLRFREPRPAVGRSRDVRGAGPGDLHATPQDAGERAARVSAVGRGCPRPRPWHRLASTAAGGRRRSTIAELVRLADAFVSACG